MVAGEGMKVLVLGGTVFVGRAVVEAALARGHEVALFTRGRHGTELFPKAEKLRGDRDGDLAALRGRRFDAVVDRSGYVPRVVRASTELLADAARHHVFVSTAAVLAELRTPRQSEDAPLAELADPGTEDVLAHYGPLKAACERVVQSVVPGRALVVRPGIIDSERPEGLTLERIARVVATHFQMTVEEIKSKNNSRAVAVPRQVAMYLCKRLTKASFPEIGREFGGKHHTTVMHSVDKIESLQKEDRNFHRTVSELIDNLCN